MHVDEVDRLTAAAFLQVAVGSTPPPAATGTATLEATEGARTARLSGGSCIVITPRSEAPTVLLSFADPGTVVVTPSRDGAITTQLQPPDRRSPVRSRARVWPATGGDTQAVSSSATELWLRVGVPAEGTTRFCNVGTG